MHKLFLPTFLFFAMIFTGIANADEPDNNKWGVVDIAKLMKESEPGKAGVKFIEQEQAKMQARLDEVQTKLEKDPQNQELMQELQKVYAGLQQQIQQEGQNVANKLFDAVQSAINDYRKANGYAMLIGAEALASFDPSKDVTPAVMEALNKTVLEFKPLAIPAAKTPEPAKAADPAKPAPEKSEKTKK